MSKPLWLSTPRLLWPYNFLPDISILRGQNHENIMHENVLNQELQFEALPCLGSKSWWKLSPYFSKKWWFVLFNFLIQCTIWSQIAIPRCTIISHVNFSRFGPLQIKISDKNLGGHIPLRIVNHLCAWNIKQDQGSKVAPQVAKYPHVIPQYPLNQILQLLKN